MIITLVVLYFIGLANPNFVIPNIGNTGINWLYFGLFVFFVIASFTDFLDGYLARKNNQVTDLGKFLDPVADKLLVNSMVIFLIVPQSYAHNGQMNFSLWCAILLVARDIVVDALRFIAAQKNVVIAANIFGKAKTVLEMVAQANEVIDFMIEKGMQNEGDTLQQCAENYLRDIIGVTQEEINTIKKMMIV